MWRDVLIASLNKGQFLIGLVGMIFTIMILKMPSEDVSKLVFEIINDLKDGSLYGYLGGIISIMGWFLHAKGQRRRISKEMERIGREKSKLQSNQLGGDVRSSE